MTEPTASTAYGKIVERVFGEGTFKYDTYRSHSNNVTGALLSDPYHRFVDNLIARLLRLRNVYEDEPCLGRIVQIANRVASSNSWKGAFGELAALDFFNTPWTTPATFLLSPVRVDLEIPASRLLKGAHSSGPKPSEIDGFFADFDVYYDAKVLKDNVQEILERIHSRVSQDRLHIVSDYPLDGNCDVLSNNFRAIEKELSRELDKSKEVEYIKSAVVPGLRHTIIRRGGWHVTGGNAYSPYRHAQEVHQTVFADAHQFVTDRPFVLTMVNFPWFKTSISPFRSGNMLFYRAVARRVFCSYKNDQRTLGETLGESRVAASITNVPIATASRNLSALIFLEDNCILAPRSEEPNISAYLYMNPNCENSLSRSFFRDYAQCDLRFSDIDDFEYDNY